MTPRFTRRWGWGALKFILVVLGIAVLLRQLNQHRTVPLSALWNFNLLAGWWLSVLAFGAFAARFRLSLRIAGLILTYRDSLRINALGAFLDFVVPLTGGGDAAKYLRIRATNHERAPLLPAAGIALDHFIGFVVALFLTAGLVWRLPIASAVMAKLPWLIALSVLVVIVALILNRIYRARTALWIARIYTHRRSTEWALMWSVLMQTLLAAAVYLAAKGSAITVDYLSILWVLAASALSAIIPVKIGGLGARDVIGTGLFILLGIPTADAVLLATILYGYRATIAVAGGLVELVRPTVLKRDS